MRLTNVLFYIIAMTAAVTDWRKHRIPDGCCMAIVFLTVPEIFFGNEISAAEHLLGSIIISGPMFLAALFLRGSFGGGDIKFTAACGFYLGWRLMSESMLFAAVAAGVYAGMLLFRGYDRKTHVPLGPFLVFGILIGVNG